MIFERTIKPLQFNENGVAIGANKYFVEERKAVEGLRPTNWEAFAYLHDMEMPRFVTKIGHFNTKEEAERACNGHNQLHIFQQLLTDYGQNAILDFEIR
jgi:hypothetical protein